MLKSSADFDAADLRALLRAGPFRKCAWPRCGYSGLPVRRLACHADALSSLPSAVRDALRKVGKSVPDPKAGGADAEKCFKELEALDFVLIDLAKGDEDKGDDKDDKAKAPELRADATARIGAAIASLDAVLAQLPLETMSAARAALE